MSVPRPSYENHQQFILNVLEKPMTEAVFKNNIAYNLVLENVDKDRGTDILKYIETKFPQVTFEEMRAFIQANDKYGGTNKTIFTTSKMKLLYCSPTSLRYILHALLILNYYKETMCQNIVEVGCGYGGLFLAINMFSAKFDVTIKQYILVDLPMSAELTRKYLELHSSVITIPFVVYDSTLLPANIPTSGHQNPNDTFFISNYCFTAIEKTEASKYVSNIIQPCTHGFLVWQTCFGDSADNADAILGKTVVKRMEEEPQTGPSHAKNYYIYF